MTTNIKPKWKDAPTWAKYLAQDGDGSWYWYSEMPMASSSGTKVWVRKTNTTHQVAAEEVADGWIGTLERRP